MDNNDVNNREGYLYLLGARGYSAYEVAVQNGFVGTEEEWLASLKGDKGDTGNVFDNLTPEQKAEIKGDAGKSAYDIAVEHGFIGTEQDWVNAYLSPDGYVRNADVVDNLTSTETQKPLSANQGRELKEDVDDINENLKSNIIEDIEYLPFYNSNSNSVVHVLHIPHQDGEGNIIRLKRGFANDVIAGTLANETASNFSKRKGATVVINASIFNTTTKVINGLHIHEGVVVNDNRSSMSATILNQRNILAYNEEGILTAYKGDTLASTILNDGNIECLQSFIPIVVNGENNRTNLVAEGNNYWDEPSYVQTSDITPDYDKIYFTIENTKYVGVMHLTEFVNDTTYYEQSNNSRYQRQCIAQNTITKDYYVITSEGKGVSENLGLTLEEFVTIAQYYNCDFAFILDSGGSTATVYKNEKLNLNTDEPTTYSSKTNGEGKVEREVPDFLYFSKEINTGIDENINYVLAKINKLKEEINLLELALDDKFYEPTNFYENPQQHHTFTFNKYNKNTKEFDESMRIYFDNTGAFPGGLSIQDLINNKTVLRIHNNESQGITYLEKKLGLILDEVPQLSDGTDLDNLSTTFVFARAKRNQNLNGAPITASEEGFNYFILQFGFETLYRFQIAFSLKQAPIIIKARCNTGTSWGAWQRISIS